MLTEIEKTMRFFVTILSLMTFQLGRLGPLGLPRPAPFKTHSTKVLLQ